MRARKGWLAGGAVVGIGVLGWTAAWMLLAREAERAIDRWRDEEKARERIWSCAERKITGFPFSITVDCWSPSVKAQSSSVHMTTAARLEASSSIFSRRDVNFRLSGPVTLSGPDFSGGADWSQFTGTLTHGGDAHDLSVRVLELRVSTLTGPAAGWTGSTAREAAVRIRPAPDRAPGSGAQELTMDLAGLRAPPADAFVGNEEPLKASLAALVLNANGAGAGSLIEKIDRWSASGGRLLVKSLTAEKGKSNLEASGEISLDERRRPEGRVSLKVAGVQPILARFNLPAAPLAIEGLLRGSNNRSAGASLLENRALPLEMRNGRLFIGPIRTPIILPPLL